MRYVEIAFGMLCVVAIINVLVRSNSQTPAVLNAGGSALGNVFGAVTKSS
jgi:hypothetical protein